MSNPFEEELSIQGTKNVLRMARMTYGKILDERAISLLERTPTLLHGLLVIRERGAIEFSLGDVRELSRHGLITADHEGFYLSDVVEDILDLYIQELKKEGLYA